MTTHRSFAEVGQCRLDQMSPLVVMLTSSQLKKARGPSLLTAGTVPQFHFAPLEPGSDGYTLPMPIEPHPSCPQPNDESVPVWRFLSLAKYLDLILSSELHFSRLDQFEDPYEGMAFGFHRAASLMAGQDVRNLYAAIKRQNRSSMFVNAWHLAEHEPAGMWKQYANEPALAVCSIYAGLKNQLDRYEERVFLGLVKYEEPGALARKLQPFDFVMAKRPSFEHEKEVRALIWRPSTDAEAAGVGATHMGPKFVRVPVDLNAVVKDIRLSPYAPNWLEDVLWRMNERLGLLNMPVRQSTLFVEPDDDTIYF